MPNDILETSDFAIYNLIQQEAKRQKEHLELIASENYVSQAVLAAQGSILTNKYAEGYPSKRYYGGCEYVDGIEKLAIERAQQLFGAAFVNVQPHSGSQANYAVYHALLNPGDTILSMDLSAGGHLTHGSKASMAGKLYQIVHYGLNPATELVDYEEIAKLAHQHKPKLVLAGFSAYSHHLDWQKFREIADSVGAYLMVDMAHIAGLVAAGICASPVPFADVVTSTTHKTLRGPRGGLILARDNPEIAKKINSAVFPGSQGGPLMHVIAAKAVAFHEALQPSFKVYQEQIVKNARVMAQTLKERGFDLVGNGTENHLILMKLIKQQISGQEVGHLLGKANITVNKNSIPNDPQPFTITSGIRLGTPAITTRGLQEKDCQQIAYWIADLIHAPHDEKLQQQVKQQVIAILEHYPVP